MRVCECVRMRAFVRARVCVCRRRVRAHVCVCLCVCATSLKYHASWCFGKKIITFHTHFFSIFLLSFSIPSPARLWQGSIMLAWRLRKITRFSWTKLLTSKTGNGQKGRVFSNMYLLYACALKFESKNIICYPNIVYSTHYTRTKCSNFVKSCFC